MGAVASTEALVLDVPTTALSLEAAARDVVARARAGAGGYGCLCNVHVLMTARRDQALRAALADATWVFADGAPIAWLQRRDGVPGAERVAGADLMWRVLALGREDGLRHALFGSTPEVLAALLERIERELPGVDVVAAVSPPFAPGAADAEDALAALAEASAHVVWCALGAPRQELWLRRHASALAPAVVLGVGAAFDFLAETKSRAPRWLQALGLEWLHRLATEPRRLGARYLSTNTRFLLALAGPTRRSR